MYTVFIDEHPFTTANTLDQARAIVRRVVIEAADHGTHTLDVYIIDEETQQDIPLAELFA